MYKTCQNSVKAWHVHQHKLLTLTLTRLPTGVTGVTGPLTLNSINSDNKFYNLTIRSVQVFSYLVSIYWYIIDLINVSMHVQNYLWNWLISGRPSWCLICSGRKEKKNCQFKVQTLGKKCHIKIIILILIDCWHIEHTNCSLVVVYTDSTVRSRSRRVFNCLSHAALYAMGRLTFTTISSRFKIRLE